MNIPLAEIVGQTLDNLGVAEWCLANARIDEAREHWEAAGVLMGLYTWEFNSISHNWPVPHLSIFERERISVVLKKYHQVHRGLEVAYALLEK